MTTAKPLPPIEQQRVLMHMGPGRELGKTLDCIADDLDCSDAYAREIVCSMSLDGLIEQRRGQWHLTTAGQRQRSRTLRQLKSGARS